MHKYFSGCYSSIKMAARLFMACMLIATVGACTTASQQRLLFQETVWDVAANQAISANVLIDRSRTADIVLLGETHDNPAHHRIQNAVLNALSDAGSKPSLVMEQFDFEQQPQIDMAMSPETSRTESLLQLKHTMAAGWEWPQYQVLIATAKDHQLPLRAANLSRNRLQQVSRQGFSALGSGESTRLALDAGWSEAQEAQLEKDIVDGHCGMLPVTAAPAVARAQRARDAMMADALLNVRSGMAVAILGREHVRRDLSVPLYLATRAPKRKVIAVGLIELDDIQKPDDDLMATLGSRYDYLVLTAPVHRTVDPCKGLVMPTTMSK
jgi:uncharacterized iron-regulated protein